MKSDVLLFHDNITPNQVEVTGTGIFDQNFKFTPTKKQQLLIDMKLPINSKYFLWVGGSPQSEDHEIPTVIDVLKVFNNHFFKKNFSSC